MEDFAVGVLPNDNPITAIMQSGYNLGYDTGYRAGQKAAQPKWISVEERLPEEGVSVLIYGFGCMDIGWIIDTGWRSEYISDYDKGEITHWMPMPEPPKEE